MSRWKPFIWFGISLLCFAAAIWFWQWGERRAERDAAQPVEETYSSPVSSSGTGYFHLVSQPAIVTNDSDPAVFQEVQNDFPTARVFRILAPPQGSSARPD